MSDMFFESVVELANVAIPIEDILFGVEVVPNAVGGVIPDGTEVEIITKSMFALMPERISFRVKFAVNAGDVFRELTVDVASNYAMPEGYLIANEAFVEYANVFVAPHMRSYAQTILNGLLTEMKLPPRILPRLGEVKEEVFAGSKLPAILSSAAMVELRANSELDPERSTKIS